MNVIFCSARLKNLSQILMCFTRKPALEWEVRSRPKMKGEGAAKSVIGSDLGEEGPTIPVLGETMSWNKKF